MTNKISLETLKDMDSCLDGQLTFKSVFGNKKASIKEAFSALPKQDVIWFVVHGLYSGHCPPIIRTLIDAPYHPNRKRPAILWLDKNYDLFIDRVLGLN
jgi:hypothetical protein